MWNPGLINIAVTRALGDIYYKNPKYVEDKCSGMIAEPEIVKLVLTKEDEFLVLATDGEANLATTTEIFWQATGT